MSILPIRVNKDWAKILASVVSLGLFLSASFTTAFFWSVFLIWLAFRLDSRMPAAAALLLIVVIPNLLALGRDEQAEMLAVYAFFLLCITVGLQIIELVRDGRDDGSDEVKLPPVKGHNVLDLRKRHGHDA